ncbi:TetR/AcrR family transcriptional regulator [Paenibacillus senegalensis]|uniref:TetR/AcrR family transcriptional regulator n=1 Tax=Paenibacillus senegalensis TaxID=1465766 RepID=UPI000300C770|nr:TetR/AcrR family transcriptional regulator [Paenibacillus senegalensis]
MMSNRRRQGEQTKRKVAEAARELFALKGYTATSIEDIVAETGSSKGNIYYHFKSKEGLFLYLLDEWDQEWLTRWEEREDAFKSVRDKLVGLARLYVEHDLNHPLSKACDEFMAQESDKNEVKAESERYMAKRIAFNRKLLEEGMRTGEIRTDDAHLLGLVLEAWMMGVGEIARRYINEPSAIELYMKSVEVFLEGAGPSK